MRPRSPSFAYQLSKSGLSYQENVTFYPKSG